MENDVLKNQIAPWQDGGRWYKLTLEVGDVDDSGFYDISINHELSDDIFNDVTMDDHYIFTFHTTKEFIDFKIRNIKNVVLYTNYITYLRDPVASLSTIFLFVESRNMIIYRYPDTLSYFEIDIFAK